MIRILLGTNEKTKITILVAGIILLIVVAVTLGLFIGLLDPVSLDSQQIKTLSKTRQGNWTMLPFNTGVIWLYKSYVSFFWTLSFINLILEPRFVIKWLDFEYPFLYDYLFNIIRTFFSICLLKVTKNISIHRIFPLLSYIFHSSLWQKRHRSLQGR